MGKLTEFSVADHRETFLRLLRLQLVRGFPCRWHKEFLAAGEVALAGGM
jgi:hypothetical protein